MKTCLITRDGYEALKKELDYLWREHRPEITQKVAWAIAVKMPIISYNPILYTNHKKNIVYQYKKYIIHTILVYYLLSMAMVENGVWIILILKFTKLQKITKS